MEEIESKVEIVAEPKVDTRFGFLNPRRELSSTSIKICASLTSVAIIVIFLIRSPEKPKTSGGQISTPNLPQNPQEDLLLNSYSVVNERKRLRRRKQVANSHVQVHLPGLQKIDRRKAGQIPSGTQAQGTLAMGASNGPVSIKLDSTVQVSGETLIPAGSLLRGVGQSNEDRLLIHLTQVVYKDGAVETISANVVDPDDDLPGLRGSKFSRKATKFATSVALNFASGMSQALQDRQMTSMGMVVTDPSMKNALLNGTSQATVDAANETMGDMKNKPPAIQKSAGEKVIIVFDSAQ